MTKANILIVEDEGIVAQEIQGRLQAFGYRVAGIFDNGNEAIRAADRTRPDLVLMDIRLKGEMDGMEAADKIRTRFKIPVIYLTAYSGRETVQQAKITEPFGYITKPFEDKDLHAVIEMALYKHKVEKEKDGLLSRLHKTLQEMKAVEIEKENYRTTLEAIFSSLDTALITMDLNLKIIAANEATNNILGCSPHKIIGKNFLGIKTPIKEAGHLTILKTIKSNQPVREYPAELKRGGHANQTVLLSCNLLKDPTHKITGTVLAIKDISRLTYLERELKERHTFRNIIGKSNKMQRIFELVETLSDIETSTLITGESGTGKELICKALHYGGKRRTRPMVTVNCSALAENLLESELFGHVKGAFTDAVRARAGRFKKADGGTIFLDEIGTLSPRIQVSLLRVLQEKTFEMVGDSKPINVDVRIIAATNSDLREKMRQGSFREDLYYRLKVVEINLPPLRERREDIPILIDHFIERFNKKNSQKILGVSDKVMSAFMNYHWPGNIRELEHTIEHAFVLCKSQIVTLDHLPSDIRGQARITLKTPAEGDPSAEILKALDLANWNKSGAARILGISRPTLYKKMSAFKIIRPK